MKIPIFSFVTVLLHLSICSNAQLLRGGKFVGYERMDVRDIGEGKVRYWPGMNLPSAPKSVGNEVWFHQVTISIYQDSVSIWKVPVVVKNASIIYSDSTGGFFVYKGEVQRTAKASVNIYGQLVERKHTGAGHSSHATPFYAVVSYSDVSVDGDKLQVGTANLGQLIFRRVK